jgi:amino acid adenylation domain-containing protein
VERHARGPRPRPLPAPPDAPAVASGDGRLSFRELAERSEVLARRLRHLGAGPETRVGLYLERSVDLVVGILGVLRAGAAYLPLDPAYPAERLAFMLRDGGAPLLVTHGRLAGRLAGHGAREVRLDAAAGPGELAGGSLDPEALGLDPDNLAYVIYTSGSSGRPKGVQVSHRNISHSTAARATCYREPVRSFLLLSSFAFDSSVAGIFGTLSQGGLLVVAPGNLQEDAAKLGAWIERERVTHLLTVPSLYALLLDMPETASLRGAIVAGEACPPELVTRHFALRPGTGLWNEYGPTEGSVWSTVYAFPPHGPAGRVPIGRPIANVQVYIVDRDGRPAPLGVPGELWIGGGGVTRGYLGRPELAAEKFIPDPWGGAVGARLYRTGDLVRALPDGEILFLGRIDQQVKIRGYRIELEEIETALRACPGVRNAVVAAVESGREGGPGAQRLAAFLVLAPGAEAPQAQALRAILRDRLPEHMVPGAFTVLPELPLTPNGKVDRRALARADGVSLAPEVPHVAPRTPAEETVARLWSELLGVERVGVHDNFFDLGGHSLLTTQLASRLRDAFQLEVPLQAFFEEPTVAGLAQSIEVALWARETALEAPGVGAGGDAFEEGEI